MKVIKIQLCQRAYVGKSEVNYCEHLDLCLFVYVDLRGYDVIGPHLNWTDSILITYMHKDNNLRREASM